ncbi:MAG: hypothetical protein JNL77_03570 [Nitrosomonas sp.]|nr:hypothetical protein [Nitrosomonas sp.]
MKNEGKLRRNWLKGSLGDALNAILCGVGHNLRMILRAIRLFCAWVLYFPTAKLIAGNRNISNSIPCLWL